MFAAVYSGALLGFKGRLPVLLLTRRIVAFARRAPAAALLPMAGLECRRRPSGRRSGHRSATPSGRHQTIMTRSKNQDISSYFSVTYTIYTKPLHAPCCLSSGARHRRPWETQTKARDRPLPRSSATAAWRVRLASRSRCSRYRRVLSYGLFGARRRLANISLATQSCCLAWASHQSSTAPPVRILG